MEIENKVELKPCPFCGGEAVLHCRLDTTFIRSYVYCKKCGVEAFDDIARDESIKKWNMRVEDKIISFIK